MAETGLTPLLADFGISYPDAPRPSPALLAFTRGLGLNLDEAKDRKDRRIGNVKRRSSDARADLNRTSARGKENVTADLLRRGIHSSGEANTRYARHGEDLASASSDIARTEVEGITAAEDAFGQIEGGLRTGAMEKVLTEEQRQATEAAAAAATEASWTKREEADETSYQRTKAEADRIAAEQEALMREIYKLPPKA
jgi:hypothetical protein